MPFKPPQNGSDSLKFIKTIEKLQKNNKKLFITGKTLLYKRVSFPDGEGYCLEIDSFPVVNQNRKGKRN